MTFAIILIVFVCSYQFDVCITCVCAQPTARLQALKSCLYFFSSHDCLQWHLRQLNDNIRLMSRQLHIEVCVCVSVCVCMYVCVYMCVYIVFSDPLLYGV